MSRTGKSPKLAEHTAESFVDMHPQDALLYGVRDGELARVATRWGSMVARVRHGGGIARGSLFVPIHWNNQTASDARVGALVNPVVDPLSGEPEFKHTPACVAPFPVAWHGFILSRTAADLSQRVDISHWTRIQGVQMTRHELAGRQTISDHSAWARSLCPDAGAAGDWLEYQDRSAGIYRAVQVIDDRIAFCLFLSPNVTIDLPARNWLSSLFALPRLSEIERAALLLGQPMEKTADTGATVCSCFGVGCNTITDTIRRHGLKSVGEVTACLKAGGNCGSCVPEIKKLLTQALAQQPQPNRIVKIENIL